MLKGLLILACVAHVLCGYSDCLLSYGKNGRLNLKEINDPAKMSKMFDAMPLWQPMASILVGTFSITAFTFGYLALASWMHGYNTVTAYIMLASTVLFVVPIVTHHIICGLVEWFYIKLGRTEEARKLVLDFQKKDDRYHDYRIPRRAFVFNKLSGYGSFETDKLASVGMYC